MYLKLENRIYLHILYLQILLLTKIYFCPPLKSTPGTLSASPVDMYRVAKKIGVTWHPCPAEAERDKGLSASNFSSRAVSTCPFQVLAPCLLHFCVLLMFSLKRLPVLMRCLVFPSKAVIWLLKKLHASIRESLAGFTVNEWTIYIK